MYVCVCVLRQFHKAMHVPFPNFCVNVENINVFFCCLFVFVRVGVCVCVCL